MVGGDTNQEKTSFNVQDKGLSTNFIEINAAAEYKKVNAATKYVTYKKIYKKVRYKYKGKYRYKWVVIYKKVYRYKKVVKAATKTVKKTSIISYGTKEEQILRGAARFRYSSAAHNGATMERIGGGDCWAMSDFLQKKFNAAGIRARTVQYANSYTSKHRSVQLYKNGAWVDISYKKYGINNLFSAQTKKPGMKVVAGG
jgi:hypothetical protein